MEAYLKEHLPALRRHFLSLMGSARFRDLRSEVEAAEADKERLRGDEELRRASWDRARLLRLLAFAQSELGVAGGSRS